MTSEPVRITRFRRGLVSLHRRDIDGSIEPHLSGNARQRRRSIRIQRRALALLPSGSPSIGYTRAL